MLDGLVILTVCITCLFGFEVLLRTGFWTRRNGWVFHFPRWCCWLVRILFGGVIVCLGLWMVFVFLMWLMFFVVI